MKVRYRHLKGRARSGASPAANRSHADPSGTFALRQRFATELGHIWNGLTANAAQSCLSPQLWGRHLHAAYQQGVERAFNEVQRGQRASASSPEAVLVYHGARQQFVASTFQLHALPTLRRVFREYEQRSRQVFNRLQSRLATAPAGLDVSNALDRASNQLATLARLGVVRAHAEGQLDGYQSLGIGRVKLFADAGGCRHLHNTSHPIDQARGTIPRHGVCRCAWLPAANAIPFPLVNRAQGSLDAFSALLANYSPEQPRDERGRWTQEMSGEYTHAKPHYETRDSQDPTLQREEWDKIGSRLPPGERRSEWTSRGDNHPVGSRRVDSSPLVKFESEAPESTRSTGHGSVAPAASSSADSSSSATGVRDASTEKIRTGDVETKRLLGGGCNGSYHVYLDNGEEGVWKPRNEEDSNLRMGIPEKTQYKREAAAYAVAEAIGMADLVPPTTIREIDGEVGSIQQWQGNSRVAARVNESQKYDGETDLKRAAVFDYLVGNSDRHQGNWMINNDGKLRLIDHGLILPTNDRDDYVNQQILEQAQLHRNYTGGKTQVGYSIPADVVHLREKWPAIEEALQKCGIEPAAIDKTHNRLIDLTEAAARGLSFGDLPPIFGGRLGGSSSRESSPRSSSPSSSPLPSPSSSSAPSPSPRASGRARLDLAEGLGITKEQRYKLNLANPTIRVVPYAQLSHINIPPSIYDRHGEAVLGKLFPGKRLVRLDKEPE